MDTAIYLRLGTIVVGRWVVQKSLKTPFRNISLCLCLLRGPVQKVQKVQKDTRFHIFFYKRYLVLIM